MGQQTTIEMSVRQNEVFHELKKKIKRECRGNFKAVLLRLEFLKRNKSTPTHFLMPGEIKPDTSLEYSSVIRCWKMAIAEYKLEITGKIK